MATNPKPATFTEQVLEWLREYDRNLYRTLQWLEDERSIATASAVGISFRYFAASFSDGDSLGLARAARARSAQPASFLAKSDSTLKCPASRRSMNTALPRPLACL